MEKKLIVRIAEGLGNQLFMYANSYALSKELNYNMYIDDKSGFIKTKNFRNYYLNHFNVSSKIISDDQKFNTFFRNIKRKFLKKIDLLKKEKTFLLESTDYNKKTYYNDLKHNTYSNKLYVEGHYESEKYFLKYREQLLREFSLKDKDLYKKNSYHEIINKSVNDIVSICIRTNRFSEREGNKFKKNSKNESIKFTRDTINYVYRAIDELNKIIPNAKFLIWSNDFSGLREYFPSNKFIFIENSEDKILNDFYLLSLCKNFIVGPTSFHWWGAWLNDHTNKLCYRPKNLNPSNNSDFWPSNWISI